MGLLFLFREKYRLYYEGTIGLLARPRLHTIYSKWSVDSMVVQMHGATQKPKEDSEET